MTRVTWLAIPEASDLAPGEILGLMVGDRDIAVYRLESGEVYATDNLCTHGHALLSEGWIVDECKVECPLHAGCFDIRTGRAETPPAETDIAVYEVRVTAGSVEIALPE